MSPSAVAAFAVTLLVLAIVGFSAGYLSGPAANAGPSAAPSTSTAPTATASRSPSPSPEGSETASPSPSRTDTFAMPNLVGKNFIEARNDALALGLGVKVNFKEPGLLKPDGEVLRTFPAAKTLVFPNLGIVLYVKGDPPPATVPAVAGKPCTEAITQLANAGFAVELPGGSNGNAVRTEPGPDTVLVWNDRVQLFCAI